MDSSRVVFFDGYCGVCDGAVALILPYAREAGLRFAPLQSEDYRALAGRFPALQGIDSIVYVEGFGRVGQERIFVRGAAVLEILRCLPARWAPLRWMLEGVPAPVRDFLYDLFARNRNRIAKRRESCRLPTSEERELFLP